jgi:flagellar hook-associated protein 3 FlgL
VIGRVTQQTMQRSTLANLQSNMATMADLQGKMSSGKVLQRASDDPAGTAQAMALRAQSRATHQYQRNADDGLGWLTNIDSAIQTGVNTMRKARDLVIQGGDGSLSASDREALAVEIEGLRDSLLAQANTNYLGRSVFAGTSDAGIAFSDASGIPPYDWTGSASGSVTRRIGQDSVVRVDADGSDVFGTGAASAFALLDDIAADLRSTADVTARMGDIDSRMSTMLANLSSVGTRYNQLTSAQESNALKLQDLSTRLSGIEDVDFAQTIVELQMQEVAYQGALGATSRVLQPTLMDFLR